MRASERASEGENRTSERENERREKGKRCLLDELHTLLLVDIFFGARSGKLNRERRDTIPFFFASMDEGGQREK